MTAPTACPRHSASTAPLLRLASPTAEAAAGEAVDVGGAQGLFDRWFEAWAERAHHVWSSRGWCHPGTAPYL
ncbi:hypothetical protein M8A51_05955 [Schlegelella sp. S2-27]|uniref:Uncharacterized protein n=1 Tax=Caldimonas mangrovi TaxID=2944811 RepID=A0ABT0YK18_9BURK|nr:hypothetical protein [Caldimonas mangrovi]MCM5679073.1 hypothetical protein [Caldimonas mangrovi]